MATVSRASESDKPGAEPDNQIKLELTTAVIGYWVTTKAIILRNRKCEIHERFFWGGGSWWSLGPEEQEVEGENWVFVQQTLLPGESTGAKWTKTTHWHFRSMLRSRLKRFKSMAENYTHMKSRELKAVDRPSKDHHAVDSKTNIWCSPLGISHICQIAYTGTF